MSNNGIASLAEMSDAAEEAAADTPAQPEEKSEREQAKIVLLSLSRPGKFNILQDYMIEIHADAKLKEGLGQRFPTQNEQLELLRKKIEVVHKDDLATQKALLLWVPSQSRLSRWGKLPGWEDSVIQKMKMDGLFTAEKRAEVIEALRSKAAKSGDVQAAKVWLTMSGDYTEKVDVTDSKFEKYKEYMGAMNPQIVPTDDKE